VAMMPVADARLPFSPAQSAAGGDGRARCRLPPHAGARHRGAAHPAAAADVGDGRLRVRAADASDLSARLKVTGEVAAGRPFERTVGAGEAVRIFTGG